ncbi:hypothetical protein OG379_40105 (plasmid) [Streptomyces sp. NBC_01166]|uniref:hypothetical protein n=1 Tax=Streptomyces sp. NBC_01166 TaxID=2903755 RepID=UPI002F918E4C|nr:hypothetical protein OG379_40105 [Streptomyces sp. NBC_01166]
MPWIEDVELACGAYRFELSCWWHTRTWTKDVTVAETAMLVDEIVDQALAAAESSAVVLAPGQPPPDTTLQARRRPR